VPRYPHGHAESVLRSHGWRTAANSAGYLLPHLRPGHRLLDVGCGPGTLTLDLAARVAPGTVIGIDPAEDAITAARRTADSAHPGPASGSSPERRLELVCTELGGFVDADGFDVVHAHQVLQHLADPVAALRQMAALCRPGGVIGVRDADYATFRWFPDEPALDEWLALYQQVARSCGGQPDAGRRLLAWARRAGFDQVECSASAWCFATPQDRAWWAGSWSDRVVASDFARLAVDSGLATTGELQRLRQGWLRWQDHDDGWFMVPHGEILVWPPVLGRGAAQLTSTILARSCSTALVCIWQIRDSVTPSTRPISASVNPS
jgi:SAM-dependent methyltransferase